MYNLGRLFLLWVVYYTVIHFFLLVLKVMLKKGHLTLFVTCLCLSVSRTVCLSVCLPT